MPEAMTEYTTVAPLHATCDAGPGCCEIDICPTVSATALEVDAPHELVTTQSYDPESPAVTGLMVSDADVALPIFTPPLRHWNVGAGVPPADTM